MNQIKDLIYKPCRILYYNSCTYTFFETYLDKDTLLLGNNNTGKTSFLNGLQLFLLPETTFKKAGSKFNFKDHKQEDSYNFYFPSRDSFIIAEFQNPFGKFVQVLFRGNDGLEYSRIFTKEPYENIREKLWDSNKNPQEVKEVNGNEFTNWVKKTQDAVLVNKVDDLINLMYSNSINEVSKGRYSLVPLNLDGFKFETMKNIIKLAFNIDLINNDDLKDIFVNIIESNYINKKDASNINLLSLCEDQEIYKKEMNEYIVIENHRELYNECSENIQNITILAPKISSNYTEYVSFYNKENDAIILDVEKRKNSLNFFKGKIAPLKTIIKELEKTKNTYTGNITMLGEQIKRARIDFNSYTTVMENYTDLETALLVIKENVEQINSDIQLINDKDKLENEISRLNREILSLKKDNKETDSMIEDKTDPEKICNQLPEDIKDFYSSFLKFNILVKKQILTENELNILSKFHELTTYNEKDKKYYLFGESICTKNSSLEVEDLQNRKIKNLQTLDIKEKSLSDNLIYRNNEITKNKANLESRLKKLNEEKHTIINCANSENIIAEKEIEIININSLLTDVNDNLLKHTKELESFETQSSELENVIKDKLYKKEKLVESYKSIVNSAKTIGFNESMMKVSTHVPTITMLTEDMVNSFDTDVSKSIKIKSRIKAILSTYIDIRLAFDPNKVLIKDDCTAQEMKNIFFEDISPRYEHLENHKTNLKNRIMGGFKKAHNDSMMINDHKKQIELTIANINHKLEKIKVSNFDKICIKIENDPKFDEFNIAFDKTEAHNPTDEDIDNFFFRLTGLLTKFNIQNKIKIEDILRKVHIVYDKDGLLESKSQSNGTLVTTNAMILSVLKEELIAQKETKFVKFQYYLPIVIDEVAKIDNVNLKNLHAFLKECNFIMFCATPTPTISTDNHYDITISLSNHIKSKIFNQERKIVHCLPNPIQLEAIESTEEVEGDLPIDEDSNYA